MENKKNISYSIYDAFKSLDDILDEDALDLGNDDVIADDLLKPAFAKTVKLVEEVVSEEVEESDLDMDEIDRQIEQLHEHLRKLKEKYDKNPKLLTETEYAELKDAKLIEEDVAVKEDVETLVEETINLRDKEKIEHELDEIERQENEETIEIVVDVDADTREDLRDSYVGCIIIQCPVCKTLIYKDEEDIVRTEDDDEYVNLGDTCPHCKSEDGFIIVGKVASLEKETDEEDTEEIKPEEDEKEEETVETNEEETDVEETNESVEKITADIDFDDLNEELFNRLATKYLNSVYENVEDFKTTSGEIDEDTKKITLEGVINFKSGKTMPSKFIFEMKEVTKKGKLRLFGMNESLSNSKKMFTLVSSVVNKTLLPESLTYNYSVRDDEGLQRVYGRVVEDLSKIIKK